MVRKVTRTPLFLYLGIFIAAMSLVFFILHKSVKNIPCANTLSCKESLELSVNNDEQAVFNAEKIDPPKIDLLASSEEKKVLGIESSTGDKHIYVDLGTQTLKAYEGETLFLETKISSGKWFPTPTGDFKIWRKVRSTKMSGGQGADYYYLPNVPYVMFFSNSVVAGSRGFSLHGTYWHNNFGHPMSHGCVNMRTIDAQKIFYWTDPPPNEDESVPTENTPDVLITIYGEAP
ncbi:hypothetical protein A3A76_05995 [Candidatus Woesebacteria bacterium RIFCSPLOWO2_01_FULL_39_23]|uniref:L,D-TPase catalytic domain-containing protein n=1 Tax=Candidatus Woesebacteria bacterium RIFCSPHIGHO2_01_FULL_40_22 TaxID=1802499 RepID=A0A1F7YHX1_9BACT|nr:MAG: hypothetical protein A2141_02695 [Candidatus Woesebacteria bacterium RBG_16_40_11]OGM26954.1 MAG: hypothetical protein A2628_05940 [Candidatus Woesebacteria bacterium RIFCSPHIGHO2_01_FULL_40_22]OGM37361.1 MAG: hypothetical protein A3E41_04345 [Candidatus Woesebacteria bacterium RIFCSPHIGHO2_12_FULL_38_9]OGM63228.1 MAG: hypothetical protein A3A76_05995 [Candidatus Woesebacteria bacterium RIFCSPLOWO2_01_FULL_39_23]